MGFLNVLPLNIEDFFMFVNLGHLSPPGHIFPSGHGGFYLSDHLTPVPVFCPADMIITRIAESEHVNHGFTDYGITLSVNDGEFQIVFGHMSKIHETILEEAKTFGDIDCETYTTAGDTYINCSIWTEIQISAGDTLGWAGGNPGQLGLDFGTYDKTKQNEFATARFDDYLYPYSVSPLDYFTEEIHEILIPICGDSYYEMDMVRTKPPIGGTIDYDIEGTAQGLWFKVGEPLFPEDPHMALVYHNVDPDMPIFSIGNSLIGLDYGWYTFTIQDTGYIDRSFDAVKSDGHIYKYNAWYQSPTPYGHMTLLLQMIDETHLKIEKREITNGSPLQFSNNAVLYDR